MLTDHEVGVMRQVMCMCVRNCGIKLMFHWTIYLDNDVIRRIGREICLKSKKQNCVVV